MLNKKLWVATAVLPLVAASLWAGSTASAQPKAGLHGAHMNALRRAVDIVRSSRAVQERHPKSDCRVQEPGEPVPSLTQPCRAQAQGRVPGPARRLGRTGRDESQACPLLHLARRGGRDGLAGRRGPPEGQHRSRRGRPRSDHPPAELLRRSPHVRQSQHDDRTHSCSRNLLDRPDSSAPRASGPSGHQCRLV